MPGGGLAQLIAMGAQDFYLSSDPQISFYNVTYRKKTRYSVETFIIKPPIIEQPKIQLRNLFLTVDFIKNMVTMLQKHQYILLYQYHVNRVLKNTECPITLNEITELYLECNTCKMCYDYNTTIHYFKQSLKCSYCRQDINITPLGVTNGSQIYIMLKKKENRC